MELVVLVRLGIASIGGVAALLLAGCGVSTADEVAGEAPVRESGAVGAAQCKDNSRLDMCVYVDNAGASWQAPVGSSPPEAVVTPWAQDTKARKDSLGCNGNPGWDSAAAVGQNLAAYYESCNAGIQQSVAYKSPAGLGAETLGMYAYIPYLGALDQKCESLTYVACSLSKDGDTWQENFFFTFHTNPVLVQVVNQVKTVDGTPVALTRTQDPTFNQMKADPVVPSPATIAAGATGYYGLYAATSGAPTFSSIYTVKGSGSALDGGKFFINVSLDANGKPTADQTCQWRSGQQPDTAPMCSIDTTGGGGDGGTSIVSVTLQGDNT